MPISAAGTQAVGRHQVNHFKQPLSGTRSAAQSRFFRLLENWNASQALPPTGRRG